MPINYQHGTSDADLFAGQMKATRGQLAKVQRELDVMTAERERDPYCPSGEGWRAKLAPLTRLRDHLARQLRDQEQSWQSAGGAVDAGPRALSSGAVWLPPDS